MRYVACEIRVEGEVHPPLFASFDRVSGERIIGSLTCTKHDACANTEELNADRWGIIRSESLLEMGPTAYIVEGETE